ncbi:MULTISPECIES: hypothetical protein [Butyricimonas]|uniref:hypothetical protein n=1 Tax=Butyricimonas TaxID=574697 RepID=UPI001D06F577|nr:MULTISPECIES: hypothetical protein [Butyricimonas]MCB6971975.1 hypothetical protein [Butyricimonas synergistica]MCG4518983.1 hypothetical protein [Butyricimonas sp. DFI.6.44]
MVKFVLLIVFLFFFYACHRENMNALERENELENFDNRMFDNIDIEVYDSLIKRNDFQYLAALYKENRNAIYSCEDKELSEQYLKADTIRSLISYYSKKLSCSDLSLYIAKYVDTELVIQSRCLLNEKIEDCWKRAWDFYDKTFVNKIYELMKNPDDIRNDIASFLSGTYGVFGVQRVFVVFQDKKARPSGEWLKLQKHGLINLLLAENINISPIFDGSDVSAAERDVHNINRCLNDGFYWYYTSNRWKEIGELKKNPNACPSCGENPCICYHICPQCGKTNISCICCKKCGRYPCICYKELTPAWGIFEYQDYIMCCWNEQKIESYLENLSHDVNYCILYNWNRPGGPLGKDIDRPYTEPYDVSDFTGVYVLHTNMKYTFDLVDIYSFAKNVNNVLRREQAKGYPENFIGPLFAYFVLEHDVYALVSMGRLGVLGEALSDTEYPYRLDNLEFNIYDIVVDKTITYKGKEYHYAFENDYEKKIYQVMKLFQMMNCDIEIFKLKRGGYPIMGDQFVKGWYSDRISNEEDIIK